MSDFAAQTDFEDLVLGTVQMHVMTVQLVIELRIADEMMTCAQAATLLRSREALADHAFARRIWGEWADFYERGGEPPRPTFTVIPGGRSQAPSED